MCRSLPAEYISATKRSGRNNFDSLVRDGFKMAYKQHVDVATGIIDSPMVTKNGVEGIYFSLGGNTATASQFFDRLHQTFFTGALYFDATPNADSLGIVNDFLKKMYSILLIHCNGNNSDGSRVVSNKNPGGHGQG